MNINDPASEAADAPEDGATSEAFLSDDPADDEEDEGGERVIALAATADGERLDKWLASQLPDRSRSEVQRWIDAGRVSARGRTLKASYRVAAGDEITAVVPEPEAYDIEPEPIPLVVLYEDADLLVIDKPAGMVVHPAAGNWHGTLVNAVLHHAPDLAGVGGARRPGIVHRLDKDTSGLIVVAKNDLAHRALQSQFKAREVEKTYLALVSGAMTPETGEIDAPIGRDPRDRKRMAVVSLARGRASLTRYETLEQYRIPASGERFTLLACHPLTGRTHQIRVHLAHIHHPIAGDPLYGSRRKLPFACPRLFLHAHRLRFRLPATGESVEFTAPLAPELAAVRERIEGYRLQVEG
jgi:23S rRNA pseudouridine1911/1915/1917 synthase